MVRNLDCRKCPYGREDFERRMALFENNSVFDGIGYDDAAEQSEKYLWCDKVGGKTYYYGYCDDILASQNVSANHGRPDKPYMGMQKKRERSAKNKKHLEELYHFSSPYRAGGAYKCYSQYYPCDKIVFYKRDYRSHRRRCQHNYFKKYANKKVRYFKGEISNGSSYRRISGLQWIIRE